MLTRSKTAKYLASKLATGNKQERQKAVNEVASWLVSTKRTREIKFLEQDTAKFLADDKSYVFAKITTARELSDSQKQDIASKIKNKFSARELEPVFSVDKSLIGGIKIEVPDGILDNSVKRRLINLIENIG